ncbi:MAG TPA: MFS transporter [Thermoanaerobaculia bacterium]|nr:MFS transporter [Thermoanaerobaculia bacterium]
MHSEAFWRERLGLKQRVTALAAALFVFAFGQELWFRYLPEYLRVLGGSAFAVGLFGTWKDLLDAAYAYPGGVLADRLGTRACLLLAGGASLAGVAVYLARPSLLAVFVGLMLVMCWSSLGLPSTFAVIGEELAGARRVVAFSVQAVVKRIPILLAPPLGGLLLEELGVRNGMRAGFAISGALALFALLILRRTPRPRASSTAAALPDHGSRRVRLHPALRQLLVADCLIRLCEGLPDVFLVIWAIEVVKVSPVQFGILTSVLMATAILSYLPGASGAERVEKKTFVLLTYVFFSLFPLAVFLSRSFLPLLGAYVLGGLREIGEPARKALIVDLADPLARGKTVGLYYAIRGFSVAGAAAIGGLLWTVRPALTFSVAAALGLAGTAWAAAFLPTAPRAQEAAP